MPYAEMKEKRALDDSPPTAGGFDPEMNAAGSTKPTAAGMGTHEEIEPGGSAGPPMELIQRSPAGTANRG